MAATDQTPENHNRLATQEPSIHGSSTMRRQGSQFPSADFIKVLAGAEIKISMDGKGAWRDNVFVERHWRTIKYEEVYLRAYASVSEARALIERYIGFYNTVRRRTRASWLNMVERFFAQITTRRIRKGSYTSVDDLEAAIYDYLGQHNTKPKPFTWTKTAEDILTRERRALDKLDEIRGNR